MLGSMIFSAIKFLPTLKSTIIPVKKFLRADSNYIRKEKEHRRQNSAFITYRIDFINQLSPVIYLASIAAGYTDNDSAIKSNLSESEWIKHYHTLKRAGFISINKYNLLLSKAINHNSIQINVWISHIINIIQIYIIYLYLILKKNVNFSIRFWAKTTKTQHLV